MTSVWCKKKKRLKSVRPNDHHSTIQVTWLKSDSLHFSFFMIMLLIVEKLCDLPNQHSSSCSFLREFHPQYLSPLLLPLWKIQKTSGLFRFSDMHILLKVFSCRYNLSTPSCGHSFHLFPSLLHVLPLAVGNADRVMIICNGLKGLTNCKRLAWFLSHHNYA